MCGAGMPGCFARAVARGDEEAGLATGEVAFPAPGRRRRGRDGASCVGAIDGVTTVRKEVEASSDLRCCEAKAATSGRPRRGCDESRSARSTGL